MDGCNSLVLIAGKSTILLNYTELRIDTVEPVLVSWDFDLWFWHISRIFLLKETEERKVELARWQNVDRSLRLNNEWIHNLDSYMDWCNMFISRFDNSYFKNSCAGGDTFDMLHICAI